MTSSSSQGKILLILNDFFQRKVRPLSKADRKESLKQLRQGIKVRYIKCVLFILKISQLNKVKYFFTTKYAYLFICCKFVGAVSSLLKVHIVY